MNTQTPAAPKLTTPEEILAEGKAIVGALADLHDRIDRLNAVVPHGDLILARGFISTTLGRISSHVNDQLPKDIAKLAALKEEPASPTLPPVTTP